MEQITKRDLQLAVDRVNDLTGMPKQPYALNPETGRHEPQAGCYHLSWAYGGVQLHRMSLNAGCTGVTTALYTGYTTKRDLYNQIHSFIRGLEAAV